MQRQQQLPRSDGNIAPSYHSSDSGAECGGNSNAGGVCAEHAQRMVLVAFQPGVADRTS